MKCEMSPELHEGGGDRGANGALVGASGGTVTMAAYPNPVSRMLNIEVRQADWKPAGGTMTLRNAFGQQVWTLVLEELPSEGLALDVHTDTQRAPAR
ncbi:MAG: hypothetical protein R2795_09415 [Saprospiraceae bacterium]